MKRYYVYAGYYEVWISDKVLRRPLMYQGWHKSLDAAIVHAESMEPEAVCFDESLRDEVTAYYEFIPWDENPDALPFFDGRSYDIRNGLSDLTLEYLKCEACRDTVPSVDDKNDIVSFLKEKTGVGLKRLYAKYRNFTYGQLRGILAPFLAPVAC